MARKAKLDNALLKRLQRERTQAGRPLSNREVRKRFLIICEGIKTEPNYFIELEKYLTKGIITIDVIGTGTDTINIVDIAIQQRDLEEERAKKGFIIREYDEVWAVFDKDSFLNERFNSAIFKGMANNINCAYSNEAFEIWYLLHFEFYNTGISRNQYNKLISKHLGFTYKKNSKDMYRLLQKIGNEEQAIKWAQKLNDSYDHKNPAEENPSTTVYKLVEKLNSYKRY